MLPQSYRKAQYNVNVQHNNVWKKRYTTVILRRIQQTARSHTITTTTTATHIKSRNATATTTTSTKSRRGSNSTGNCRIGDRTSSIKTITTTTTWIKRILWKPLNNHYNKHHHHHHQQQLQRKQRKPHQQTQQQYIIWLFLLFLLSHQHSTDCRPTEKWNHRMQRRFMWKQMDSSVDGFVDRVVSGARVMKGMIGEFMPRKQAPGNVLDYLPTETTRVKYIIRNPHTKETKVIKIRPSKKVIKLMAMTPKPIMADKHKTTTHMLGPEKLRQMEREQELIAEGKQPMKQHAADRPMFMALTSEKHTDSGSKDKTRALSPDDDDNDIINGSIHEFGDSWKPVYKVLGETASGYSTVKPVMMSSLHTSVVDEMLPQPQKQIYEPLHEATEEYHEHDADKTHTYEVTEYTAEESIVQPYTHEYYSYRDVPLLSSLTLKGSQRHQPASETHNVLSHKEEEEKHQTPVKSYVPEYRTQRGLSSPRTSYRANVETTTAAATTTTSEEPNYPASFLKKYRERPPETHYHTKLQTRNKPAPEIALENSWLPSNVSYSSARIKPSLYHHSTGLVPRIKSQKWPPDTEETQSSASSYEVTVTTDSPTSLQDYATHTSSSILLSSVRNTGNSRKNVRLKSHQGGGGGTTAIATAVSNTNGNTEYHRPRNLRQRGTVRFGDKLETD